MNLQEHAVLNAINSAGHLRRDFWATAQEIADEVATDDYLHFERKVLGDRPTAREIGYYLRRMATPPSLGIRGEVMVEKRRVRGQNQWRATQEAIRAVCI